MTPRKRPGAGVPVRKVARRSVDSGSGLAGVKVVVTGVPVRMSRSLLESKVRSAGGVVTTAVSGVTNYLVYGAQLEDGRPVEAGSKFRKAAALAASGSGVGLEVLSEEDFLSRFPELLADIQAPATNLATLEPSHPLATLWTERWRPEQPADFVFNHGAFRALHDWLTAWPAAAERGCLLCGPPGVGKTSAVLAVCKLLGYQLLEFNASDTRSRKQLQGR
ncbi:Rad17 cell cycle checkpoint protein [Gregarina niphandrodes]|uniref:Rad17 cell cycle checkpoint protein n=1 Tax=Gregarina niphandrodes TaxID=110365 RepID=A0A023AZ97_GRENI|nr:Rad17 cell cycle checkpoint protein [Gregarina niphandrodes]EZG43992.1 Rad17 cell cycle checkpoint protein [Gregarina niphandrodes]|eukprot:XP_011132857.1 Rad17 cell cycle checkpoint protein [Gregarina niphandrodes]